MADNDDIKIGDFIHAKSFTDLQPLIFLEIYEIRIVDTKFHKVQRIMVCSNGDEYWLPVSQCDVLDEWKKKGKQPLIVHLNEMREEYIKFNCTYYSDYMNFVEKNYWDIAEKLSDFIETQADISHPFSNAVQYGFVSKALSEYERYKHLDLIRVENIFTDIKRKITPSRILNQESLNIDTFQH